MKTSHALFADVPGPFGRTAFWVTLLLTVALALPLRLNGALVDNGDGTITDTDLGIMWLKTPGPDANWTNAVAWANALVYAGHSDWRLPSALHFTTGLPDTTWNSVDNEFGHLYGDELGNPADAGDILPFVGYGPLWFWTDTSAGPTSAYAFFWSFDGTWLNSAGQPGITKATVLHVTAVRTIPLSSLTVSPTTLAPSCTAGTDAAAQSFQVWNSGQDNLSYTITDTAGWLSCSPTNGTSTGEHDTIAVTYGTAGLAEGTYNATITVTAPGAGGSPQTVEVTLTVLPAPTLAVSPASLTPACLQGTDAAGQSFEVWNSGGGTLNYTVADNVEWLSCAPTNGTTTGEHDSIAVSYSTAGLASGTHNGTITVTATGAGGSPQTILVTLRVSSPMMCSLTATTSNTVTLTWPSGLATWLENTPRLESPTWSAVPGSLGAGQIELAITGSAAFFRVASAGLPPVIVQQPVSQAVAPGDEALFTAIAAGEEPLAYQWRFKGANLPGANSPSLLLTNVQTANVGAYTAVITNASGVRTSSPAVLVIRAPMSQLVLIPSGQFVMGSPDSETGRDADEGPQTAVTLSRDFWIGADEVTQAEYMDVMGSNPSYFTNSMLQPVEFLAWDGATNYCRVLTLRERGEGRIPADYEYRLPTEAEWECAARAGTVTRFSHGDDPGYANLTNYAWYAADSGGTTHPVGAKLANPWGLYDTCGNVWEWCLDWHGAYPGGAVTDPEGATTGSVRVLRGGSYYYDGVSARSANRGAMAPDGTRYDVGLRVVLAPNRP